MSKPKYEYKTIFLSDEPVIESTLHGRPQTRLATLESAANRWAVMGWRTVGIRPNSIFVEREFPVEWEYKRVGVEIGFDPAEFAQELSDRGWETVSVIPPVGTSLNFTMLMRRPKS